MIWASKYSGFTVIKPWKMVVDLIIIAVLGLRKINSTIFRYQNILITCFIRLSRDDALTPMEELYM